MKIFSHSPNRVSEDFIAKVGMIDIETGGLGPNDPILEYAYSSAEREVSMDMAPVSLTIDDRRLDDQGNVVKPSYKRDNRLITSRAEWKQMVQGDWAESKFEKLNFWFDVLEARPDIADAIKADMAVQDSIQLSKYVDNNSILQIWEQDEKRKGKVVDDLYYTPRGLAREVVSGLIEDSKNKRVLMAANLPFESLRLGKLIDAFFHSTGSEYSNDLLGDLSRDPQLLAQMGRATTDTISNQDIRNLFEANYKSNFKLNILDQNNLAYINAREHLREKTGSDRNLMELWSTYVKETKSGLRTADLQDIVSMAYSGGARTGLVSNSHDIATHRSIDYLTRVLWGEKEEHHALQDTRHQRRILEALMPGVESLSIIDKGLAKGTASGRVEAFIEASKGIFSGSLGNVHKIAATRDYETSIVAKLGSVDHVYKGSLRAVAKERALHGNMALLAETIRAVSGEHSSLFDISLTDDNGNLILRGGGGNRMPFGIADKLGGTIAYGTKDGRQVQVLRGPMTDQTFINSLRDIYVKNAHLGNDAAKEAMAKYSIDRYADTRAAKNIVNHGQLLKAYNEVAGNSQAIFEQIRMSGDKGFKDQILAAAEAGGKSYSKLSYLKWYAKKFPKELGVVGAGAAALGYAAYGMSGSHSNKQHAMLHSSVAGGRVIELGEQDNRGQIKMDVENLDPTLYDRVDINSISRNMGINRNYKEAANLKKITSRDFEFVAMDGDTVRAILRRDPNQSIDVRMAGVDTPETSTKSEGLMAKIPMMGGVEAKEKLQSMIDSNPDSYVILGESDKYDRTVGMVFAGDQSLNLEMVRSGMGASLAYEDDINDSMEDQLAFSQAGKVAYAKNMGIWKLPFYQEYMRQRRATGKQSTMNRIGDVDLQTKMEGETYSRLREDMMLAHRYGQGDKDKHNSIEALTHNGIAHAFRAHFTDFGSGYKGSLGSTKALDYVEDKEVQGNRSSLISMATNIAMGVMITGVAGAGGMAYLAKSKGMSNEGIAKVFGGFFANMASQAVAQQKAIWNSTFSKEARETLKSVAANTETGKLSVGERVGMIASTHWDMFSKAMSHTTKWLKENWVPDLKKGDPVALGMAALSAYEVYDSGKKILDGDFVGVVPNLAVFAGSKYAYMGYKKYLQDPITRKQSIDYVRNMTKADWAGTMLTASTAVGNLMRQAQNHIGAQVAFGAYGVHAKPYYMKLSSEFAAETVVATAKTAKMVGERLSEMDKATWELLRAQGREMGQSAKESFESALYRDAASLRASTDDLVGDKSKIYSSASSHTTDEHVARAQAVVADIYEAVSDIGRKHMPDLQSHASQMSSHGETAKVLYEQAHRAMREDVKERMAGAQIEASKNMLVRNRGRSPERRS